MWLNHVDSVGWPPFCFERLRTPGLGRWLRGSSTGLTSLRSSAPVPWKCWANVAPVYNSSNGRHTILGRLDGEHSSISGLRVCLTKLALVNKMEVQSRMTPDINLKPPGTDANIHMATIHTHTHTHEKNEEKLHLYKYTSTNK